MSHETIQENNFPNQLNRLPDAGDLRILTVLNRHSSNFPKAQLQFERLQELGFAATEDYVETAASRYDTAAMLSDILTAKAEPYHAVISITGDGGSNTVGQSVHESKDSRIQNMPVIFGRGGGACDLHAMTQGSVEDYLSSLPGQTVRALHPLDITARTLDAKLERHELAFAHMCIGKLGRIAYDVNGPVHRGSKLLGKPFVHELQEFITAAKAIKPFDRFYMREAGQDKHRLVSDIVITNGNQMGRRVLFPDDIFEPVYHQVIAPNLTVVLAIGGLLFAGNTAPMAPRIASDFYITRRKHGKIAQLQYDGETFALPFDDNNGTPQQLVTQVKVSIADKPLQVATNRSH